MRVLFATIKGGLSGGANIASLYLMQDLKRRGVDVHAAVQKGELMEKLQENGIPCYEMQHIPFFVWPQFSLRNWKTWILWPFRLLNYLYWNWKSTKQMIGIINDIHPDLVETCNSPTLYGYFACKKTKTMHIWALRELLGLNVPLYAIPYNKFHFRKRISFSYTISITKEVANHYGCNNPIKDFVVTDGVMHESEARYCSDKKNYFLYVGLITSSKGCDDLFDAFIIYASKYNSFDLLLAGKCDHHYKDYLMNKIEKSGINPSRVKFLGFRKDRYDLMAQAQATIVPSLIEGFGFITVEAMMNGCLVIGRNTGGTKQIMDSVNGCELPFNTVNQMAERMEEVQNNGINFYKERVMKAQDIAKRDYTIERCGNDVLEIYKHILLK